MVKTSSTGIRKGLSYRDGLGDIGVAGIELEDALAVGQSGLLSPHSRAFRAEPLMMGISLRGIVGGQQLANLQLHQLQQLGVVHHVDLVHVHNDIGHADLTGKQDVLAGLGHGAVRSRNHDDRTVHLGGAGDHVLDVIGMARAVDVGVVALLGLVLHVGRSDRDAALPFLGSLIYLIKGDPLRLSRIREASRNRRRQGGLPMVDMADGADVDMGFLPFELFLSHREPPEVYGAHNRD
jgi:hypothetical protein